MKEDKYICAICGKTYDRVNNDEWSDEKALEEYKQNFPNGGKGTEVCDDCYKVHMERAQKFMESPMGQLYKRVMEKEE